jgi:UDP-N-acetylglucosamine acyltransferase
VVGLRRRGLDKAQLHLVRAAHKFIFCGPGVFADRVTQARAEYGADPYVTEMLDFMAGPTRHGLITTVARATGEDE